MSSYIATPIKYAEELLQKGNYKKAGAYLEYQVDMFRGTDRTFSDYSRKWNLSKSTTHKWVKHFKIAIKNHHIYWSEANEKHVKMDDLGANASANGKTNAQTPTQTEPEGASANAKANASANDHTIYINNINNIVGYLNAKTGKTFRAKTEATRKLIVARLKEGYDVKDFQKVIDTKSRQWLGTDQEEYLRPITLFRSSNFESYLNATSADTTNNWEQYNG